MKTLNKQAKQSKYDLRLAYAMAHTVLKGDHALVASTTRTSTIEAMYPYTVKINPVLNVVVSCNCAAHSSWCIHMEAVSRTLDALYISFYKRIGLVGAVKTPDEIAAEAEAVNMQKLAVHRSFYAVRGQEIAAAAMLPVCDGCCKLFKPSYEGQATCNRCDA